MEKLKNFEYQHVELMDSHWKTQRTELIETYLKIENDDLLHYFRQLADIPDDSDGLVVWQQCFHVWSEAGSVRQTVSGDKG